MLYNGVRRVYSALAFLSRQAFYPILLSSALACAILAARLVYSHHGSYRWMTWNLFLAWVPYLASLWVIVLHRRHPGRWWRLLVPAALWLIFFPNAPYMVTDLAHLRDRPPVPVWYDAVLIMTFAWTGCFLGLISLRNLQGVVRDYLGRAASWLFVAGTLGLAGLGIYMGRFMRLNSWDLVLHPVRVLFDVAGQLAHPFSNPQTLGFTVLFAAFLMVCYLMLASIQHFQRP